MHFPSARLAARLWEKLLWGCADIWELSAMPDLHTSLSYTNPRRVRGKGKKVRRKTSPTKLSLQHRPAEELRLSRPSRDFIRSVNNSIATGRSFVSHMQASIICVLSRLCHTPRKIWRWQWKERKKEGTVLLSKAKFKKPIACQKGQVASQISGSLQRRIYPSSSQVPSVLLRDNSRRYLLPCPSAKQTNPRW